MVFLKILGNADSAEPRLWGTDCVITAPAACTRCWRRRMGPNLGRREGCPHFARRWRFGATDDRGRENLNGQICRRNRITARRSSRLAARLVFDGGPPRSVVERMLPRVRGEVEAPESSAISVGEISMRTGDPKTCDHHFVRVKATALGTGKRATMLRCIRCGTMRRPG